MEVGWDYPVVAKDQVGTRRREGTMTRFSVEAVCNWPALFSKKNIYLGRYRNRTSTYAVPTSKAEPATGKAVSSRCGSGTK